MFPSKNLIKCVCVYTDLYQASNLNYDPWRLKNLFFNVVFPVIFEYLEI